MNIAVVGAGRMGLPLACLLAKNGACVTLSDVNETIVRQLSEGNCPYEEPGLPDLVAELHKQGRLGATTNTTQAVARSDAVIVIVPAHLTSERDIDFRNLESASIDVAQGMKHGSLVVYETTMSPGGTRSVLIPVLEKYSGRKAGDGFLVAYSPERVKANLVLERLATTPKIIGGFDARSRDAAIALYRDYLGAPITDVGTIEAAEMTKLLGMLYRDVNIALANELAAFCEMAGVDFARLRAAVNSDNEAHVLVPGIGVGGHCTPVYPYFLTQESRRRGITQRISEAAREINDGQPGRQLDRVAAAWKPLSGKRVHIMGLGFRPGVKVDTLSPAYSLRVELEKRQAIVTIEDPYYSDEELTRAGFRPGRAEDASMVVLNTAHPEFLHPDFERWQRAGVEVILDGRNIWQRYDVEAFGLVYFGIGRSSKLEQRRCQHGP